MLVPRFGGDLGRRIRSYTRVLEYSTRVDRNISTGTDRDIFGWLILNNCFITSYRTLVLVIVRY